jgi:hypothetical protein
MTVVQYSTRHLVRPSAGMHAEEACHEISIRQISSSKPTLGTTNYTRVSSYFLCLIETHEFGVERIVQRTYPGFAAKISARSSNPVYQNPMTASSVT